MPLDINCTCDFDITGVGDNKAWEDAEWSVLSRVCGNATFQTKFKALYSSYGLYFLFYCEDRILTCSGLGDFGDLYEEDVIEIFLMPNSSVPIYFEYELSPLNEELPLLVSNNDKEYYGWLPFQYKNSRRTVHKTRIYAGEAKAGSLCDGWSGEFFIPYLLLEGVNGVPPAKGDIWSGNFYRIDYDNSDVTKWGWEKASGTDFHNYISFGEIKFT